MPESIIHVRRDIIQKDNKSGKISKAIGVETKGMRKRFGYRISIHGPSEVVYQPDKPRSCGAKAWMRTDSDVTVHRDRRRR